MPVAFLPPPPFSSSRILTLVHAHRIYRSYSSPTSSHSRVIMSSTPPIQLDSFAFRQFDDPHHPGTKIPITKQDFMSAVITYYHRQVNEHGEQNVLIPGYAPFCKHIFMPNFVRGIIDDSLQITENNTIHLKTKYEARRKEELPVLKRFFPQEEVVVPESRFLDLILYSKEQCEKENKAMGRDVQLPDSPWRLIAIKGQNCDHEIPMEPITMMRNELISQGGSGVPIDREKYLESVAYWEKHAVVE